ncbi:hypothetical protein B591_04235 [Streptomyces sp. GBA 94-10 4N24]|uniref:DNA glycosylase AlkZ-like family protein n=1 Tax=unclassified Streptomyces TaxID=2593676 RepID=UPI0003C2F1B5|nr:MULTISPECIES: crosslink repair DNA glycosylase YcaQ family protein [unclassified Streptomyces]ESQ01044.1 hypothetical protein B591_04235 [Streptomyces sp. GBA 94-10 4N24]MBT3157859.1 winged helix DNA-binding domain-containing protein [Streptomyces sp. G11C]UYM25541.1 winged helix DNA-binding domain-containing protein [Streptomyces albus]UZN57871.1 hypothetical protein B591N_04235 [Streptomyces sp. GBA 94-10 4N24]
MVRPDAAARAPGGAPPPPGRPPRRTRHRTPRPARRAPARPGDARTAARAPGVDNLLLSHADRTRVLPDVHRPRLWTGSQPHPVLLLDGRTAGLRHHAREGDRATLTVRPFAPDADLTGVTEEARRLLALLHPEATEHEVVTGPA